MVLDEASSRLDPATDRLIERALDKLLGARQPAERDRAPPSSSPTSSRPCAGVDRIMILEQRPHRRGRPRALRWPPIPPRRSPGCCAPASRRRWHDRGRNLAARRLALDPRQPALVPRQRRLLLLGFFSVWRCAPGLITRVDLRRAERPARPPALNVWSLIALWLAVEVGRFGLLYCGGVLFNVVPLPRRGALQAQHDGAGSSARPAPACCPASPGEAVSRFRDDVLETVGLSAPS